jgi:hypothetical protein
MNTRILRRSFPAIVALIVVTMPAIAQEPAAPGLASLFNTAGNIGFATVRASFAGSEEPLPQAVVDSMLKDFSNARHWGAANAACLSTFDIAQFEWATSLVQSGRSPAKEVWKVVDRMHRDYGAAVQKSTCTFGLPDTKALDAFYTTALFMGFATARASYFYYEDKPVPPAVVTQIASDFTLVRPGLKAVEKCTGSTAPIEARLTAVQKTLGAVSGKESYTEIADIFVAIENALKGSTCEPGPAAPTDPAKVP